MKKLIPLVSLFATAVAFAEPLHIVNASHQNDITIQYSICESPDIHNQFNCQPSKTALLSAKKGKKPRNALIIDHLNTYDQVTVISATSQNETTTFDPRPPFNTITTCSAIQASSIILEDEGDGKISCEVLVDK